MKAEPAICFAGMGSHTPSWVQSNAELIERFALPVTPEWIAQKTGIESRHWLPEGQTTSDMAVKAAQAALEDAGKVAGDVERIILATISPDHISPATATIVARKIGARCPAFDISAACAGFIYGLDMGAAAIRSGANCVLVIAADARSRFIDRSDPRSCVLFADGAAAVVLAPGESGGLLGVHLGAEGQADMGAYIPAGGAAMPTTPETLEAKLNVLHVDGKKEIFERFVAYTREACTAVLSQTGFTWQDIDVFLTHQGNARMVEITVQALEIPPEKAINCIKNHGNTSGATVPMALVEAVQTGRIGTGDLVLLTSVGAGYTFGAALYRF